MKETYYSRVKTTEKNHIKCLFYSNDTYIIEVDNRIFLVIKKILKTITFLKIALLKIGLSLEAKIHL